MTQTPEAETQPDEERAESDSLLRAIAKATPQEPPTIFSGEPAPGGGELRSFTARFKLISELARGGMGRVLVAHDEDLRREVAIKELLRAGPQARRRFEREALLTARLQHPGIVSVYEVVRRESGEPALVMRRVRGRPFDQVIAQTRTLEDRLALLPAFIAACDAVAYAHQAQVIHRDLKPGNVLLGDFGDTVVIDWGLAKDLSVPSAESGDDTPEEAKHPAGESPALTAEGAVMGTPVYMSPEQVRGEPADLRSDVYALGAMLYELLAGRRAYHLENDVREVLLAVRRGPPQPLQEAVPELSPELATIVARAMARAAEDRYANAGELAAELKRFQTGRLVLSHSYSTRALLLRWAKRNRTALTVSGIALLLLAITGVVAVRSIIAERDRANREAQVSQRVSDFMIGMFQVSDPSEARGNSVTAREILDKATAQVQSGLAQDPIIQAKLLHTLASVDLRLGLYSRSFTQFEAALATRQRLLGPEDPETLATQARLCELENRRGHFVEAEKLCAPVLEIDLRTLGAEARETLRLRSQMADLLSQRGHRAEAEKLQREILAVQTRVVGAEDHERLRTLSNLGWSLQGQARYDEASKVFQEVVDIRLRVLGPDSLETLAGLSNLAAAFEFAGQGAKAEAILRDVLARYERIFGADHPETLAAEENLALAIKAQGRAEEAKSLQLDLLTRKLRVFGADSPMTINASGNLGSTVYELKQYPEAEKIFRQTFEARRRVLGAEHPMTLGDEGNLAMSIAAQGRFPEAETMLDEVVVTSKKVLGLAAKDTLGAMTNLALTHSHAGDFPGAEKEFLEMAEIQKQALGPNHPDVGDSYYNLACVAMMAKDRKKALAFLQQSADLAVNPTWADDAEHDDDLKPLRGDPQFESLLQAWRSKHKA